jgi:hypothetical protein
MKNPRKRKSTVQARVSFFSKKNKAASNNEFIMPACMIIGGMGEIHN